MFEKSPASLQAFKFAQQARGMIWPPSDPVRMNAALDLFERAIGLDDKYFGGYSGAATIYAFKAMLPGQGDRDPMLAKARDLASKAREMNPAEAWVQSALAWIAFVEKDYDRSEKLSVQSLILDPDDLFALEFHGVMQILSGEFEGGLASLEPFAANLEHSAHLNFMNACIVAYFHLGRYDDTIANVRKLGEMGGDISPLLMVYLSAAYQASGDGNSAQAVVHDLQTAWPTFQPEKLLSRVFRYPEHPQAVLDLLYAAGWPSN
jgi:tetratricopeptide (TPR) repeat protein